MTWNGSVARRVAFKKAGLCAVCGMRKPKKGAVTCHSCLTRQSAYDKTWKRKLSGEGR